MIAALDIETAPNAEMIPLLPEPEVNKTLKDPVKIAADIAAKKAKAIESMALDPLFGRVICFAVVNAEKEHARIAYALSDEAERATVQEIMATLAVEDIRLTTWNGNGFDLPFIYARACLLGVDPRDFGAPPLGTWTKRYNNDRHYDLLQIWKGYSNFQGKLEVVAPVVFKDEADSHKAEIDYSNTIEIMKTAEGRQGIAEHCTQHTRLTWRLFERMYGTMFV